MISRLHFDRDQLTSFLDTESDASVREIAAHVETCPECQAELESIAESDFDWATATRLLGLEASESISVRRDGGHELPAFLQPAERQDALGRFARFDILEILGHGGMGTVMLAYDTALQRKCAVKVLATELARSAVARQRFLREARSAAAVVHPHVVAIHTVDEHEGVPYLVMTLVDGPSLQQRCEVDGTLSVLETIRIAKQIAEGLAAAHAQGLVHRDIKPANILLERGVERVQISDFGLARAIDDASMTRSGVIAGTPQYMSPEQADGDWVDHRSDLFSLGSVMYYMLAGHSPFRAETTMGVLCRIARDEPRSLQAINSDVPKWLESIVARLLHKSRGQRFQSAQELAELLGRWQAHLQQPTEVDPPDAGSAKSQVRPTRVKKWLLILLGIAFLLGMATVIVAETNKGTLRIECNTDANVPIVILQGKTEVRRLVVSSDGVKIRLRAGTYAIEVVGEDTDIVISGDQVELKRGDEWLVRIDLQPEDPANGDVRKSNARSSGSSVPDHGPHIPLGDARQGRSVGERRLETTPTPGSLRVQFQISGPSGMRVQQHRIGDDAFDNQLLVPCRLEFEQGCAYDLKLSGIQGRDGLELFPMVEVVEGGPRTAAYLAHNSVPISFTADDFEHVLAGNMVTKAIYLPDPKFQSRALFGVDVLNSTRLETGLDPIVEADHRGAILAIVRLGLQRHRAAAEDQGL